MKKNILLLLLYLQLTSCAFPTYIFKEQQMQTGLDFHNGKWLLNTVDAPYFAEKKLTKFIIEDFNKHLKTKLNYVPNTRNLLLPKNISFNPSKQELMSLKAGTGHDFFINAKAKVLKEEIGNVDFSSHNRLYKEHNNEIEFVFEIYDLNNLEIVYSKTIIGSVGVDQTSGNFNFAKTTDGLIIGAYKKIRRDINKKSIK